jgi:hypothetical protein
MLKGLVLAFGGFLIFLCLHVALFRWLQPEPRFPLLLRLWAVLGAGLLAVHPMTPPTLGVLPPSQTTAGWAVDLLNCVFIYGFLFFGYSMFYFLMDRGFSGRILIEIDRAPGRRLRPADVAARYSMEMVLRRRLDEMVTLSRSVVLEEGRYRNAPKGRRAAALFAFLKRFWRLGEGG